MPTKPVFDFGMEVWTNAAGILRPDQAGGRAAPWAITGIRLTCEPHDDGFRYAGWEYHLGSLTQTDYGWVPEAELMSAEYPAPDDAVVPLDARPEDVAALTVTELV